MSLVENKYNDFKNHNQNIDEIRKRNIETSVELRKKKRDEETIKRRHISNKEEVDHFFDKKGVLTFKILKEITEKINSNIKDDQFFAVELVSKLLSREKNPPIDQVIEANFVKNLVKCLEFAEQPLLQFEAVSALTNIASGSSFQTKYVVESGAIKPLVKLVSSPYRNISEQAVWALGNISGDGSEMRDLVIAFGLVDPLLALIQHSTEITFLRKITWVLFNLCRSKNPSYSFGVLQQILQALSYLLKSVDNDVLSDTCWALSYVTDGPIEKKDAVVKTGINTLYNISPSSTFLFSLNMR